ncbi:unnamed protein product [Clonostachys rosea]|uniref:NmrA-like domain-containing protein n=1 Tax=Bionectria ochroleuca TaxID=29856 RepID=A0ABY6UPQ2_BIOOC|nr:unnamed protein product [Clonostachys rosea]
MLVVIAGATGNLGQKLIDSFFNRGHSVRALARNPSTISSSKRSLLEGIITSSTYYDIDALDRACKGVDAVVCAYSGIPELQLEGQLLLLRAAERAGVKRFLSASWNYDWSSMTLGQQESYDPYISFRRHVETSSPIKPVYIFCGVLAEVLFSLPGHGDFSPKNHGVWDPATKTMEIWGTGEEQWQWTTERDAAEFAAQIMQREDAIHGGFWRVCSGSHTLREVAATYEKVKRAEVQVVKKGTIEELRACALEARAQGSPRDFWSYVGWFYQLYTVAGTWSLKTLDNDRLNVTATSLEDFIRTAM